MSRGIFTKDNETSCSYCFDFLRLMVIGILFCSSSSLKTADNIEVMKTIPSDRLLLETGIFRRSPSWDFYFVKFR